MRRYAIRKSELLGQFVARVAYGDLECFEVGDYEADPSTSAITDAMFNEVQGCLVASTTKRYTKWHTKQKSAPRGACLLAYWRRGRDSNPRWGLAHTRFPGVRLKPLIHLSEALDYSHRIGGVLATGRYRLKISIGRRAVSPPFGMSAPSSSPTLSAPTPRSYCWAR